MYYPPSPAAVRHPPKTFWRVLGIVGGQDLVRGLPIVQGTSAHGFDPPPTSPQPQLLKKNLVESFIVCLQLTYDVHFNPT